MLMIAGLDRFPEVFDCIVKVGSNTDCFYEDDVFPTNKYICLFVLLSHYDPYIVSVTCHCVLRLV